MLQVEFKSQIASDSSSYDITVFREEASDGYTALTVALNEGFRTRIDQMMSDQMQSLEYDDLQLSFVVNNDLRQQMEYYVTEGWVDGEPQQFASGSLDRRERVRVTSPDVVSALTLEGKQPEFMSVKKSED